jgi:hypothetical protein
MRLGSRQQELVSSIDGLIDLYERKEQKPDNIVLSPLQYQALLLQESAGRQTPIMQLTHYRGMAIKRI